MKNNPTTKNIIVYADDDIDDLELLKEGFEAHSNNVLLETFEDGDELLIYLKAQLNHNIKPCLIILDINMPRMNGKETLQWIRKYAELDTVPVIIFTTSSSPLDHDFAKKYNAGFITKPIDMTQLNIIINHFIDHCDSKTQTNIRKQIS